MRIALFRGSPDSQSKNFPGHFLAEELVVLGQTTASPASGRCSSYEPILAFFVSRPSRSPASRVGTVLAGFGGGVQNIGAI